MEGWSKRWALGCVSSPQWPEAARTQDHAIYGLPFLPFLYLDVASLNQGPQPPDLDKVDETEHCDDERNQSRSGCRGQEATQNA